LDKGTHKGVEKLKEYLKKPDGNSNYLKLDIKSFFCSINKDILYKIVYEKIVKADTAIWSLNFEVKSNNIDSLYSDIEKNIVAIKAFS
jgi:hypothetical protein